MGMHRSSKCQVKQEWKALHLAKLDSRHRKTSLLTVLIYPGKELEHPHIVDVHTLGSAAFSTVGKLGKSLEDTLESPQVLKVSFDVKNDSDALYAHYGIELQGFRDIQLMESACQPATDRRKFVCKPYGGEIHFTLFMIFARFGSRFQ